MLTMLTIVACTQQYTAHTRGGGGDLFARTHVARVLFDSRYVDLPCGRMR